MWWRRKANRENRGGRVHGRATGRRDLSGGQRRALRWAGRLAGAAAAAAALGASVSFYFRGSGLFVLRHIEIQPGETLRRDVVLDLLRQKGLVEGGSLFACDINAWRAYLVERGPMIRDVKVSRQLPDRMKVVIIERQPLARIEGQRLGVDGEGYVFPRQIGIEQLPVLTGCAGLSTEPGTRLEGTALAGMELLETLRVREIALPVEKVNVAHEDFVLCTLADQRCAKIAWTDMGSRTEASRDRLAEQLACLAEAMNSERSRGRRMFNATIRGKVTAL